MGAVVGVGAVVSRHVAARREGLAAEASVEGAVLGVRALVFLRVAARREGLAAEVTGRVAEAAGEGSPFSGGRWQHAPRLGGDDRPLLGGTI